MRVFARLGVLLALSLALAACQRGVDAKRIEQTKAGEWLTYGRTYDEQRFSPLKQINADTIGKLGVAWWAEFDTDRGQEATPLVADGVLYTTTAWSKVFAFDAKTGKPLWSFDPKGAGREGLQRLLRCREPRRRAVAGHGLRRHDRRAADRARRQDRPAGMDRADHQSGSSVHDHRRAPGHQGQDPDRQRRG
jgi:hypothetical protein